MTIEELRFHCMPNALRRDCLRWLVEGKGFLFPSKEHEHDLLEYAIAQPLRFAQGTYWMLTAFGRKIAHMELREQEQLNGFKKPNGRVGK